MRLVAQLVTVSMVAFAGNAAVGAVQWNVWPTLALGVATAALSLLAYAWVVRRTERREPSEVALKGAGAAFGRGAVIGIGMFAAVIAIIALSGSYRVDGWGSVSGAVALAGVTAAAAVTEELLFRGVLFRLVEERIGTWFALVLTGLLFGLAHAFNPHAGVWSTLAIAVEAGGMLGAAYAATRTLWVPIGLHFAWNFAEGGIFGTGVSGQSAPDGLLHGVLSGPTAVSGGDFGPEASLYALAAGLVATGVFLWVARRRGRLVPLRGRAAGMAATASLAR
ncbi:MAG: CPBP family intramembrane metalloprotease [Hamadaea sp.]|nr:CPBP family intramembrane metalloprotease [Hamadaea sp.]NUT08082.1 CPBP family intramembrane metalloprotease [Hamadaea sp.]